jgi:hypothetical protein
MMHWIDISKFNTGRGAAAQGFALGFKLALAYWLALIAYIILRSSLQIASALSWKEGLAATVLTNAASVIVSMFLVALVLAVMAAVVSMLAMLLLRAAVLLTGKHVRPRAAAIVGAVISAAIVLLLSLGLYQTLGSFWDAIWPGGYLVWVGLPGLLFILVSAWAGWKLACMTPAE